MDKILIVDDNLLNRELAGEILEDVGFDVRQAEDGEICLKILTEYHPDIILLDRMLPGMDGDEVAGIIKNDKKLKGIKIIIVSAMDTTSDKVTGLNLGVDDYLSKPYDPDELIARVKVHLNTKKAEDAVLRSHADVEQRVEERTLQLASSIDQLKQEMMERKRIEDELRIALAEVDQLKNRLHAENIYLQDEIKLEHNFDEIITTNKNIKKILRDLEIFALSDATVLILGESGTGKELFARAVHNISNRSDRPLVKVNCTTLPINLIENELFGHEKGAFTGAISRKIGRFELADGGTIFLDEIGDLPLELQGKLLRVLQEGEFERLGNPRTTKVNVRTIAATNRDLKKGLSEGTFREDLYYRLNVFPIEIPPLRERREDIPLLVKHFVEKFCAKSGKSINTIPKILIDKLQAYDWPGNIRELENIIERSVILTSGSVLEIDNQYNFVSHPQYSKNDLSVLRDLEEEIIRNALQQCKWVIEGKHGAAIQLKIPPSTLRLRMEKLGIIKQFI